MRRSIAVVLLATAPILLPGCSSLDQATGVAAGYVSHQLCSATFVSRVDPEQYYRESIAPVLAAGETVAAVAAAASAVMPESFWRALHVRHAMTKKGAARS